MKSKPAVKKKNVTMPRLLRKLLRTIVEIGSSTFLADWLHEECANYADHDRYKADVCS